MNSGHQAAEQDIDKLKLEDSLSESAAEEHDNIGNDEYRPEDSVQPGFDDDGMELDYDESESEVSSEAAQRPVSPIAANPPVTASTPNEASIPPASPLSVAPVIATTPATALVPHEASTPPTPSTLPAVNYLKNPLPAGMADYVPVMLDDLNCE